jgi:repressor LexA
MFTSLTKKEKDVLDFIKVSSQINGFAPTLMEIQAHFQLKSVSTVHEHINNLKNKGYLIKEISQPRSIKILDPNINCEDILEIPLIYKLKENAILENSKTTKLFPIHRSLLDGDGTYIAIEVNTNQYISNGLKTGDVLLLKQTDLENTGGLYFLRLNRKFYFLGNMKMLSSGKTYCEKADELRTILKNYEVIGEIITVIRKCRNR